MCGLLLAIALHRSGIDVEVFESASESGEVGASVSLGWNALSALKHMGLFDALLEQSGQKPQAKPVEFTVDHPDGEIEAWVVGIEDLPPDLTLRRAAFLDAFAPMFPSARKHFNKKCTDISYEHSSGLYHLHFQDGISRHAHLVIGADGIRSNVRRIVAQGPAIYGDTDQQELASGSRLKDDDKLMFTGLKLYRALVPYEVLQQAGLKRDLNKVKSCLGPGGLLFTIPIKNGTWINIAAWSIVSPNPPGTINPPLPAPWTTKEVPNDVLLDAFSEWSDDSKVILQNMGNPHCWAIHTVGPVLDTYVNGRIALIGDAAHASTPFYGTGVGQGIEDVFLLWKLLSDRRTSLNNLKGVLQAYDTFRPPRANRLVIASGEAPRIWPILADQNLEQSVKAETMKNWEEIWRGTRNHDVKADGAAAVRWMEEQGYFTRDSS